MVAEYEYDGHDRLVKTRFPHPSSDNTSSTTDYEQLTLDANGNVTSRRLRDGVSIGYSYDALGRLTAIDRPTLTSASQYDLLDSLFAYDNLGRMTGATHETTSVPGRQPWNLAFTWDALGRILSQTDPFGTTSYQYDVAGRRTRLTYPGSGLYVDYDYLVTGEVAAIRENGATSGAGVLGAYAYDDRGRRTSLTRGNGTVTGYAYDNVSRLTQIVQNLDGTSSDVTLDFTHNPASQIATNTRDNNNYAWGGHYAVNRAYTANGRNQYTAAGSITPTYDSRGNLSSAGSQYYSYTSENMLLQAYPHSTAHDPLGRLVHIDTATGIDRFGYDGPTLIVEYEGANGNAVARRYVHGPGIDEPLVWYEGTGTSDRRWLHADERGSVIAITNGSGTATSVNAYDESGIPGASNAGRFQYTGQMWMPEPGMYHYRARIYSPTLGRFMQTDPIGYGGGMNLYAYVLNDPVNLVDPSGLDPKCLDTPGAIDVCGRRERPDNGASILGLAGNWSSPAASMYSPEGPATGDGGGGAVPSNPQQPRQLTPEQRRRCAAAVMGISTGIVAALMGYFEVSWALASGAGRGAALGRAGGGPGIVVGVIIGAIMGYASYRAGEQARINQLCRGLG